MIHRIHRRPWHCTFSGLLHFLILVGTGSMAVRDVSAQGLPLIPDPIATVELLQYADRLDMSRQQQLALLPLHDRYLLRFRKLRDDDIQQFEDDLLGMASQINPMNLRIPPREDLEGLMRQYNLLLKKVKAVDRTLFNDVETILTETQLLNIDRVRRARECSMYSEVTLDIGGDFNPGASVDLSELVQELDLISDIQVQLDPILRSYETELLKKTIKLHEEIEAGFTIILDTIDELGLRDMTIEEMSQLGDDEGFIQTAMNIFDEASRPFQKATSNLGELNLNTYRRIKKLLDPKQSRKLRQLYFQRAYRRAIMGQSNMEKGFARALKLIDLTAEQRSQILMERDLYHQRSNPLIEETASLTEKSRQYRTVQELQAEDEGVLDRRVQELFERRDLLIEATDRRIELILGAEMYNAFAKDVQVEGNQRIHTVRNEDGTSVITITEEDQNDQGESERIERDPLLPPPIRVGRLDRYSSALGIDDMQRSILDSLYDDYRADYQALVEVPPESPADFNSKDDAAAENRQALERVKHRQNRIAALRASDDEFFNNIELLLLNEDQSTHLKPFHTARRREASLHCIEILKRRRDFFDRVLVDLPAITDKLDLPEDARATLAPILARHNEQTVDSLEFLVDTTLQGIRVRALREVMAEQQPDSAETLRKKQREYDRQIEQRANKVIKQNNQTFTQLTDRLEDDVQWRLIQAFNEKAYPDVYDDRQSAVPMIYSVLALEDLSIEQHEQISLIASRYRGTYYELSDQLVEIRRGQEEFEGFDGTIPIDLIRKEILGERLKFERDETSARTKARLRMVLSEAQTRSIDAEYRDDDSSS